MCTLGGIWVSAAIFGHFRRRPDAFCPSGRRRASPFSPRFRSCCLEKQFQRKLAHACRQSSRNLPERCRRSHASTETGNSARRQELSVIEDVKEFSAELQIEALRDLGVFQQRKIPVVDSRPMEKSPPGIALRAQCGWPERRYREKLATRISRVLFDHRRIQIGRVHRQRDWTTKGSSQAGIDRLFRPS